MRLRSDETLRRLRCGRDVDSSPLRSLGELRRLTLLGEPARDLGVLASLGKLERRAPLRSA